MRKVTPLNEGEKFTVKRMEGSHGDAFPGHTASVESVLVVTDGQCVIEFTEQRHTLTAGDTFVVPPAKWHQVVADPEFRAAHVMPREIRFDFDK